MWWETTPGLIASWAAAAAGIGYLIRQAWKATRWGRRLIIAVGRLIDIGEEDAWPNGSNSLPQAMTEIYDRQGDTHQLVQQTKARLEDYIITHRADHGLTPPIASSQ